MDAEKLFYREALEQMREDIADAARLQADASAALLQPSSAALPTVEILWIGRCDEEGRIAQVSAAARGTADMVPALFPHMARGDAVIHNHPGGDLRPSGADLGVASRLGNAGIGFLIVDDSCRRVNVVASPLARQETVLLDVDDLAGLLEPEGALADEMEGYETRREQIDLLRLTAASFNEAHPLAAEAGTGVGKSFAYLIPALRWAADNQERVLVSTATIALQQQLVDKDIPMVQRLLGVKVKTALVKGRGNYLCLKRLSEAEQEGPGLFDGSTGLPALRGWVDGMASSRSGSGSLTELPFQPERGLWEQVRCEADSCPGAFCHYFEDCFLMKARRQAADASLLVANHHLLFADLAARQEGAEPDETVVLPSYRRIVLDEAHHIETSATSLFTQSLSLPRLTRSLNRVFRKIKNRSAGLSVRLAGWLDSRSEELSGVLPRLLDETHAFGDSLDALSRDLLAGESQLRLAGPVTDLEETRLQQPMEKLSASLAKIVKILSDARADLDDKPPQPETEGLSVEVRQSIQVLQDIMDVAYSFLHRDEYPETVFWLESRRAARGGEWVAFHASPLSVAELMRESVWEPFDTVVGVSATLALGGSFDFWRQKVGAPFSEGIGGAEYNGGFSEQGAFGSQTRGAEYKTRGSGQENPAERGHLAKSCGKRLSEGIFPSPFDYASRVLLGVPADAPSPEDAESWQVFLVQAVFRMLDISGGHALVLFTSYATLRATLEGVRELAEKNGLQIFAQGEEERSRLLRRFREQKSSVLFATDSFWEGVDIPGDSLQLVIITRLPFRPPTDPVAQARREALTAAGGNAFMHLTLPEALIRFRQGFGRLMRRQDDRGAVVVLDSRICRKRYGPLFLESLPKVSRSIKDFEGVMRDLENFFYN